MNRDLKKYSHKNIQVFSGLSGIRKKPQMYIGPTDHRGRFVLFKEVADNAVDEFAANRNPCLYIFYEKTSKKERLSLVDQGQGIPTGIIKDEETGTEASALKFVVSSHHAGGKFDDKAYTYTVGTHGIGLKAVNALSDHFEVWTYSLNQWWTTKYAQGKEITPPKKAIQPTQLNATTKFPSKGTVITFEPDQEIFGQSFIDLNAVQEWCKLTAYLNAGFKIALTTLIDGQKERVIWHYPRGVEEYLEYLIQKHQLEHEDTPFIVHAENMDVAIAFTNYSKDDGLEAFTNSSRNPDGGVHVDALWKSLHKSLKPFMGKNEFTPTDIKDGVIGVLNYKINSPQFSSQTKEKLVDVRVKAPAEKTLTTQFTAFFEKNKAVAKRLCARAASIRSLRQELLNSKKAIMALTPNKNKKSLLPGKLTEVKNCTSEKRELFIVEGLSAGGCFTGDTQVLVCDKGKFITVPIANVTKGMRTLSCSPRGKIKQTGISANILSKYVQILAEITCSDGSVIRCTPDHLWLTVDYGWRPAGRLTPGTMLKSAMLETSVTMMKIITLPAPVPVYDLSVPLYQNFALENGAIVHNSAKMARNPAYQEILPLKGKVLNVYKANTEKVLKSDEVLAVLTALGYNPQHENPLSHLRVGNVYLLSDGDVDGSHINALLLGLFAKYLPDMLDSGRVHVIRCPRLMLKTAKKTYFGDTVQEIEQQTKIPKGQFVQYLKGLGEMNPDALREVAFDPQSQRKITISLDAARQAIKKIELLMADDVEYRKKLLGI